MIDFLQEDLLKF